MTGASQGSGLGLEWAESVHPDDRVPCEEKWRACMRTGENFEFQYRLRDAVRGYRWFLDRAIPRRNEKGIIQEWFGTCTDIDEERRNQQELEQIIEKRTVALLESKRRLEEEMRERALAQQELNLQNERMVRELTKRSNRVTTMAKMAELLQSCADLKDAFSVIAGMAPKVFPELRGAMLLFNSGRVVLEVAASWNDCTLPAPVFGPQDCWALRIGHMHLVKAGDRTAECHHAGALPHSYVCIPLMSQGEAIGILHFQCIGPADLTESELMLTTTFAEQAALSISNLRLREALRNQSIRDPLTGLFNRRYLEEMMERETRRAVRASTGLGVLMIDLDHFKKFNDTYGHDAGDAVLRETALFLAKSVRAEDIVCRFGGEEFVILLPMADLKATHARAERIRSKIRELNVVHQGQSLGAVTLSVGVAALPEHGTAYQMLLQSADAALYRAKHEGRDRVAVANPITQSEAPQNALEARKS
jgi:diguanylate cyclase (GGDEF)-like protein